MRKGRLNHGADVLLGLLIILLALFIEGIYLAPEPPENLLKVGSVRSETITFTAQFLDKPIEKPYNDAYFTGQETYGDLFYLALEDKEHQQMYLAIFHRDIQNYFLERSNYHSGGYDLKLPDGTTKDSYGFKEEGSIAHTLPYKGDQTIILKVRHGVPA